MKRKDLHHIKLENSSNLESISLDSENHYLKAEGIKLQKRYSEKDIENFEHLDFGAGFAPNLRGSETTMYVRKPWGNYQNMGFSTAKEANTFYRQNFANNKKEFFLSFDLPTQKGYDSDHELLADHVGKTGAAIDTVADMKVLFDQIPLDEISISVNMDGAILPIMAFYIVAAEEQNIQLELLSGTIQKEILKEFIGKNTSQDPSTKIISDILDFTSQKMPKFNSISISSLTIHDAGVTPAAALAYSLSTGLEHIKNGLATGMKIDNIAPQLSFSFAIGMNHFLEIAKMRAARMLWAKLLNPFNPKEEKSLVLKTHCQTSVSSLTKQDPYNNFTRTCIEASAAVFGGTETLRTNVLEEAITLPTDFSARIARNTQIYLQKETKITKTVDPWAGSYYVETLTKEITQKAWKLIQEIEELGGITKAIETGILKSQIEEAITNKQSRIDNVQDVIIGVNKYCLEKENELLFDNHIIIQQQTEKLNHTKAARDSEKVKFSLQKLTSCAQTGQGNLLELAIDAARNRCTLGEISHALEESVFDN